MEKQKDKKKKSSKKYVIIISIILLIVLPVIYSAVKRSPEGTNYVSQWYDIYDLEILFDLTYRNDNQIVHEQNIIDEQINMINNSQEYIIIDVFLFNDDYDKEKYTYPKVAQKLADAIIRKKQQVPNIDIIVIADPVNNGYGAYEQDCLKRIKEAGVQLVITDLNKLKDPNYVYSGLWRAYIQWFGQKGLTWLSNPTDASEHNINIRSLLAGLNAKGNHRKVIITEKEAMVTSANIHDASAYHSNVGFKFKSEGINELIKTEKVVSELSGYIGNELNKKYVLNELESIGEKGKMRIITERQIYYALIENIDRTVKGDSIYVCQFYLCDFDILDSILKASQRGVNIYMILDPNIDAMGVKLHGIPNRPAITQLYTKSKEQINIKWYNNYETQYHTKMIYCKTKNYINIIGGSANFTRKNIKGFTLENNIEIQYPIDSSVTKVMDNYFSKLWDNTNGNYTVDFDTYRDNNIFKYLLYVIEESTGFGTF